MENKEHTDTHTHAHSDGCACDHDHHEHSHGQDPKALLRRWGLSLLIMAVLLILLRSFIVGQMLVRVTSYAANSSYDNAVRICHKIIFLDPSNKQAWTALGYNLMDESKIDEAILAFNQVLTINPEDKGAASYELGQAYYSKGDYKNAIFYFERVRSAGPKAGTLLEADILKYRHGTLGFRSLNSMQTLLSDLVESYKKTGDAAKALEIQKEYEIYKNKHSKVLF